LNFVQSLYGPKKALRPKAIIYMSLHPNEKITLQHMSRILECQPLALKDVLDPLMDDAIWGPYITRGKLGSNPKSPWYYSIKDGQPASLVRKFYESVSKAEM